MGRVTMSRMIRGCVAVAMLCFLAAGAAAEHAAVLPSWNDGAARTAILEFVRSTTEKGSEKFVPPEERFVTFDQDGTLWVEHPLYSQVTYCLDRVRSLVAQKPELSEQAPFKIVMSGDREAISKLSVNELEEILYATLTGMTLEDFQADVKQWLATARHPRFERPYTELTYQPMVELLKYLRANGFRTEWH